LLHDVDLSILELVLLEFF